MLKILFWSNEKWRDEAPNRLVRRREPAGGHFIPSQMAAHDLNSGSGPWWGFAERLDRTGQIGQGFTDRNQLAAFTLHGLFSHGGRTKADTEKDRKPKPAARRSP